MASNDQVILDHLLKDQKEKIAPNAIENDFFELFVSEQIVKNYDLSYEEIESGIVGKGNDGGIDSVYTFVNGNLVTDDTDFNYLKRNIKVHLVIIQSKSSKSFSDSTVMRLISSTKDLLNLNNNIYSFQNRYNSELLRNKITSGLLI